MDVSIISVFRSIFLLTVLLLISCTLNYAGRDNDLIRAIENGDIEKVGSLIKNGANINMRTESMKTPLMIAVEKSSIDIVKTLIRAGANVRDKEGRTILERVIVNQITQTETGTFCERISPDYRNRLKNTEIILKKVGAKIEPEIEIVLAVMKGDIKLAEYLLKKKTNLNVNAWQGTSALYYAVGGGFTDCDASKNYDPHYNEIAMLLLNYGANPNIKDEKNGETPLFRALLFENYEVIRKLLEKGGDPNAKNNAGETILQVAEFVGNVDIINILVKAGAK